jgi:uncharacterized protein (TIGR02145 family)
LTIRLLDYFLYHPAPLARRVKYAKPTGGACLAADRRNFKNTKGIFMVPIKALLTGLLGVSLCMADINGIVTDTGATPIAGAIVKLENAGWTATTGADGSFTLVESTAILPGNGKLLPNGLSAGISGNLMTVNIAKAAAVEVATFDLTGKALSTVRQSMGAGTHSMALPQRGAGVYLYKVKLGNREFVLKGNSVGGASYGSAVSSEGPSSNSLSKQVKVTAAINDVIAATKTGYLNYRVVATNSDTSGIAIKMIASAGTVTDVDGNVYQTVKIGNQVWMAENLRVTRFNDGTAIPLDTSTVTWNNDTTPKYCFYNNTTSADSIKKYGALYNWYAVNTGKLAPVGWHVPTDSEWEVMQCYLVINGYNYDGTTDTTNNNIAKSLAAKTDWYTYPTPGTIGCDLTKNNNSGFSALPGGYRYYDGYFNFQSNNGGWWSTTDYNASFAWFRDLYYGGDVLGEYPTNKGCGISVRLVRDN